MRKDRTPEEIRAGWARNLSQGSSADTPKHKKVNPLYESEPLAWNKLMALVLVVLVGGGLFAWLATHGWHF